MSITLPINAIEGLKFAERQAFGLTSCGEMTSGWQSLPDFRSDQTEIRTTASTQ